ncbi:MAG: hypothetical protein ACPHO6_01745 [Candidatus Latescibacterota bacterium]
MKEIHLLQELEMLAAELAIEVRYESMERRGGLCRYGGKVYLIIPDDLPIAQRIDVLVGALARQPIDTVFVRPDIRALLTSRNESRA